MWRSIVVAMLASGAAIESAAAADQPALADPDSRWEGLTLGGYLGKTWSAGQPVSQTWYAPYAGFRSTLPSSFDVGMSGFGAGGQIGYDKQRGRFTFGVMADYGAVFGDKGSSQFSGTFTWPFVGRYGQPITQTYSQQLLSLGTIRGRVGFAATDRLLLYVDAGAAFGQAITSSRLTTANVFGGAGSRGGIAVGYALGAGAQYAVTPNLSIGPDLFYYSLGRRDNVATPTFTTVSLPSFQVVPSPETSTAGVFSGFDARITALYRFNDGLKAKSYDTSSPLLDVPITLEVRTGFALSRTQFTLYDTTGATRLSRLTFKDAESWTAEPFLSVDFAKTGLYLSGFAGLGAQRNGVLQDEDFTLANGYSSTNSSLRDGSLNYGVVDLGYKAFQGRNYWVGPLAGYTFDNEDYNAAGCTQTAANPGVCSPGKVPASALTISEQYSWRAARLGVAGSYDVLDRLTVSGNAAWLPYVALSDRDEHWLRMPGGFDAATPGAGVGRAGYQVEAKVDYHAAPRFDVGVGVRVWRMSAKGNSDFQDSVVGALPQVSTWTDSRLQAFLETNYRF